jgi:5'-3' exonuclease
MGIPGFFSYYYSNKKSISSLNPTDNTLYNYIFFDYNSLIHPISHVVLQKYPSETKLSTLEDIIIENVIEYTLFNIKKYSSKNTQIFIYIDGVAPVGKLKQQRERRYKTVFTKNSDSNNSSQNIWDSNVISPSTLFMQKLRYKLASLEQTESIGPIVIDDDPAEAEHKIFNTLLSISSKTNESFIKKKNVLIYGLDADLIILSLLHSFKDFDIFLLRNNLEKQSDFSTWEKVFSTFVLDTSSFKKLLLKDIIPSENSNIYNPVFILQDYVFISFLLGNDFIDRLPNLDIKKNGIPILLKAYNKTLVDINISVSKNNLRYLINNDKGIYLPFLKKLLFYISNSEDYYFLKLFKQKICSDFIPSKNQDVIVYDDNLLVLNHPSYQQNYYRYYQIFDKKKVCHDYLKTLFWNYFYYFFHKHSNWSWSYTHFNSPFSSDFYNYISDIYPFDDYISFDFIKDNPLEPLEQLLSILPKKSLKNVLSDDLYSKFDNCYNTIPYFKKCYPDKIYIDLNNKQYFHESKILYEPININIIKNLLDI